jgi:hypothetical protein
MDDKARLRFKHEREWYRDALRHYQQQLPKHGQKDPRATQAIVYYLKLG